MNSGLLSFLFKKQASDKESGDMKFGLARVIKYQELKKATNSFATELGHGGYGRVYLGKLRDGRMVAVKVLFDRNPKRLEHFFNEVTVLSRVRHKNLVSLYGCTTPTSPELLIVYEYVPNGTVANHLHGQQSALDWAARIRIAVETAEALAYLHGLEPPIIHRDVKTSNILLDRDFHAKVADLGICRLLPWDTEHVSTLPQGTMGYRDPEYDCYFRLTDKTDVYSFGVVLMEFISGQQAVDVNRDPEDIYLDRMAVSKIINNKLEEFVDPRLGYHSNNDIRRMVNSVAQLAAECLQPTGNARPSMVHVVTVLKEIQNEMEQLGLTDGTAQCGNSTFGQSMEVPNLRRFTFAELRKATRNFRSDTLLGEGGFGKVFKGWVDENTLNPVKSGLEMVIAVKRHNSESMQGFEEWQMKRQSSFIDVPFGKHASNSQTGNDLSANKRHQILLGKSMGNSTFRTIASPTQTMQGMPTDGRRQPLGDISNNTPSNKIFDLCTSSKSMTSTLTDKNTTLHVDSSTHATQKTATGKRHQPPVKFGMSPDTSANRLSSMSASTKSMREGTQANRNKSPDESNIANDTSTHSTTSLSNIIQRKKQVPTKLRDVEVQVEVNMNKHYQPSGGKEKPVDLNTHLNMPSDATTCNKRKKRGPTRLERLHDLKLPIKVELNELGQPIGGKNQPIAYSIGILVKEANLVPLDTLDIRNISEQKKLAFWSALLETYDLDVSRAEKWVDECKSARFRSFKSQLKSTYYENRISDEDCIRHPPPRVDPTQWANLVKYWGTDEAQEKVDQARENRGMVKMIHTAGTKSYAKRRAEYKAKHGKEMDQIELFIDCHTKNTDINAELNNKKNAIPEEERSRESLDQIYEAVVGPGSGDRVNGYGMGVTKSLLRGKARSSSSTQVLELEKTIDSLKASLEAQAAAHARALEEQATSHARAIEEQTHAQEKLHASLEDLKSMFFLIAGKIQTGSK